MNVRLQFDPIMDDWHLMFWHQTAKDWVTDLILRKPTDTELWEELCALKRIVDKGLQPNTDEDEALEMEMYG